MYLLSYSIRATLFYKDDMSLGGKNTFETELTST